MLNSATAGHPEATPISPRCFKKARCTRRLLPCLPFSLKTWRPGMLQPGALPQGGCTGQQPQALCPPTHPLGAPDLGHSVWTAKGWTHYVQTHRNLSNPNLRSWKTGKPILPHFRMWSKPCLCPLTGELHWAWMRPDPLSEVKGAGQLPSAVPHVPCTLAVVCAERSCEERGPGAPTPRLPPPPPPGRRLGHAGLRRGRKHAELSAPHGPPLLLLLPEGPACFFWVDKGSSSGASPTLRPKLPTPGLWWQSWETRDTEPTAHRRQPTPGRDAPHPALRHWAPTAWTHAGTNACTSRRATHMRTQGGETAGHTDGPGAGPPGRDTLPQGEVACADPISPMSVGTWRDAAGCPTAGEPARPPALAPWVHLCGPFSPHFIFKADFSSGKTHSSQLTC